MDTGHVTLTRYIVSEDVGAMINPDVVEGQIAGGTVQGISALLENMVYDDDGNPLSSTFVDYLLPTATEVPPIEYGHIEIPGPGVGGYKGVGEGIGSTWPFRHADEKDQAVGPDVHRLRRPGDLRLAQGQAARRRCALAFEFRAECCHLTAVPCGLQKHRASWTA